ncbi:CHD3-type chromatin-remodeling factor PICKLE [Acorus gramineus]|uniref:CHD3-type chromatin-remodeling factor PICKLE n=1 Tax=Acorus gramineus TaxID=55184 RepID=A0AAV9BXT6_ACOGR|nr:CHD3-type chromatin-remodeling factor PICKLE [Acorus gramineus]
MDFDDWDFSAEDLDSIERDALKKFSERNSSSSSAAASVSAPPPPPPPSPSPSSYQNSPSKHASSSSKVDRSPLKPPSDTRLHNKVETVAPSVLSEVMSVTDLPNISVKLFLHASGSIAAKFPYHQLVVNAFHKIPKAAWHAKERLWMFPVSSLSLAEEVLTGVAGVNVEVQKLDPLVQRALSAASSVTDLQDLYDRMPKFVESKLLPFQREGVRFILQHGGRALLADEMGLGKTLQMIQQWLNIPSTDILVVLSQYGGSNRGGFKILYSSVKQTIHLDGEFNIISYDVVPKLQNVLMASEFKIVIADESHFLKNAQAKRTSASLPILQSLSVDRLNNSGAPLVSSHGKKNLIVQSLLEALYPGVYKNVHEYGNKYCKGGAFGLYQGASNHEELHNLMKATVMIRRLKKDVLSELPVKRRQQVFLDLNEKDMKQIRALFRELETVKNAIQIGKSIEEIESLKIIQKNLINKIYTESAEAKIPAVIDYLGTVIEKKKVGCIRIDGGTPPSLRQALVTDFQEKEDIRAAVLSIKAGGVGLTLTAASTVIFAELSWTPGDIIQAEDRAHRIGQVSSVNVYYLLANDTVDDIIWDVVQSKLENLGQMLDGHENTLAVSVSQTSSSPGKQATLDSFLKRCGGSMEEEPSRPKYPRN